MIEKRLRNICGVHPKTVEYKVVSDASQDSGRVSWCTLQELHSLSPYGLSISTIASRIKNPNDHPAFRTIVGVINTPVLNSITRESLKTKMLGTGVQPLSDDWVAFNKVWPIGSMHTSALIMQSRAIG